MDNNKPANSEKVGEENFEMYKYLMDNVFKKPVDKTVAITSAKTEDVPKQEAEIKKEEQQNPPAQEESPKQANEENPKAQEENPSPSENQ